MSPVEARILFGLSAGNLALACAAAGLWKHGEDTPATRLQWRRVFGSLLPDTEAAHVVSGEERKDSQARTSAALTDVVDMDEAKRIARYMKLRGLPEHEMLKRWSDA